MSIESNNKPRFENVQSESRFYANIYVNPHYPIKFYLK